MSKSISLRVEPILKEQKLQGKQRESVGQKRVRQNGSKTVAEMFLLKVYSYILKVVYGEDLLPLIAFH